MSTDTGLEAVSTDSWQLQVATHPLNASRCVTPVGAVGGLTIDEGPTAHLSSFGWRRVLIHPAPAAFRMLPGAALSRQTPSGTVSTKWEPKHQADGGKSYHITITIPVDTSAHVQLPMIAR